MAKKKKKKVVLVRSEAQEARSAKKWQREEALRSAEVAYITDEQQRSLEWWWHQLCDKVIDLRTYTVRASKGKWADRREKYWRGVQQAILRQSKNHAIRDRVRGLQEIQKVRDNTLELIQPKIVDGQKFYKVQPSTYEGMARAFVKLDEHLSAERDGILSMIEPDLARDELGEERTLFPHDEMTALAETLLEMRRQKQQKRLEAKVAKESENGSEDDHD